MFLGFFAMPRQGLVFRSRNPHSSAQFIIEQSISNARLATPGLSLLAASNHAATSSGPMASSGILPKAGTVMASASLRVADLATRYLEEHVAIRCKPKTQRTTRSVINRHIVPALGRLPLAAVERSHVMALHESLCETPAMANMVVATLSHMYTLASDWEMPPEDCDNPCQAIPTNPERKRERFLTDAEFTRLGQVLDEVSGKGSRISAAAVTTIRLLMLTGCRRNEILTLRWEHVDLDKAEMRIVDGKTGSRTVHLSPSAVGVLAALPRVPGNPWVVPGARPGSHMTDIDGAWQSIRARAGLHDVRIHDIRHSFASRALALGEGLPIIGRLLGHRQAETTARYAHLDRDAVRNSVERVAIRIAEYIL